MDRAIEWAQGQVRHIRSLHPGLTLIECDLPDGRRIPALSYTQLAQPLAPGAWVWLNLRALDLGLGTGGAAFVIASAPPPTATPDPNAGPVPRPTPASPAAAPGPPHSAAAEATMPPSSPPPPAGDVAGTASGNGAAMPHPGTQREPDPEPGGPAAPSPVRPAEDSGYLVKARYTPLQVAVRGVDSQRSPHHATLAAADSLDGLPVVVADLHSSLPAVCAAFLHDAARTTTAPPRVVYVMTDGAALPIALSHTAAALRASGALTATITAGQAYGGDLEAVSVHSALLAAKHVLDADVAVCIQGPGNLGTDTRWGFSGVAVGDAVNAVATLGGRPVGCLRISGADPRPRHCGLSHHSLTAYGRVALRTADLALPVLTGALAPLGQAVAQAARPLGAAHRLVPVEVDDLDPVLAATPHLTTMGRTYAADPAAFLAAAAAGRLAFQLRP